MRFTSEAGMSGELTPIHLPSARRSGLLEAIDVLKSVEGLAFVHFDDSDVVRHHLVQRIIRAYEEHKTRIAEQQILLLPEVKNGNAKGAEAGERSNGKSRSSGIGSGQDVAGSRVETGTEE